MDTEEVEPFKVFISSSQKEFEKFRRNLKERIDSEDLARQKIFNAVLVENKKGTNIEADIDEEIKSSSIYIGIFGRVYSDITVQEFMKAKSLGLPCLIYRFRSHRRGRSKINTVTGGRGEVDRFLDNDVKRQGIRIRGPYYTEDSLEKSIIIDLVFQVTRMVKECANVRKTIGR